MKLPKNIKPELVASKDKARFPIAETFLRQGRLLATNGAALVSIPVQTDDNDHDGYISTDVLKLARKAGQCSVNGVAKIGEVTMPRSKLEKETQFPKFDAVLPNFEGKKAVKIALNAALLARMAESWGSEGVVIEFVEDSGIMVRPTSAGHYDREYEPGAFGVIMPIRIK